MKFETPEIEVVKFSVEDVITVSNQGGGTVEWSGGEEEI